ncbi:MAG: hypothetical protein RR348_06500, partial [Clostridia bacterium]
CLLIEESGGVGLIVSPEKGEIIVAYLDASNPNLWHSGMYFKYFESAMLEFRMRTGTGIASNKGKL